MPCVLSKNSSSWHCGSRLATQAEPVEKKSLKTLKLTKTFSCNQHGLRSLVLLACCSWSSATTLPEHVQKNPKAQNSKTHKTSYESGWVQVGDGSS